MNIKPTFTFNSLKQEKKNFHDFTIIHNFLNEEECAKIKSYAPQIKKNVSVLKRSEITDRDSNVFWLKYSPDTDWIFQKVSDKMAEVNEANYDFDLDGTFHSFQLTEYSLDQFYSWHTDFGPDQYSRRKLTAIIQLSSPDEYTGGEVQFFRSDDNIPTIDKTIGTLTIFPCWMSHRVLPVTSGSRWSLIGWFEGTPFR